MARSGTISTNVGANGVYTFWIDWVVNSQNVAENCSNLTVQLKARRNDGYPSYGAYNNYGNNTVRLTVGESVRFENAAANLDFRGDGQTLAEWSGDVLHGVDGLLNLNLNGYFYFNSSAATSLPKGGYTVSGTAAIDAIPRASAVSCTDARIDSTAVIFITRADASFTHRLTWRFGELTGVVAEQTGETTVPWQIPTSFYSQIPSSRTGLGTITCETFHASGTKIGTSSCPFTVTAVDTVTVNGTVSDRNEETIALTGDDTKLVRFFSNAHAFLEAATNNGASIVATAINGVAGSQREFPFCETGVFTFSARDSREYSASITVERELIPYVRLTDNSSIKRDSPTGDTVTLTLEGSFWNGNFGVKENVLTCRYRVGEGEFVSVEPEIAENAYRCKISLSGFDYRQTYAIEVNISDALTNLSRTLPVKKGIPVFDWGADDFNINGILKLSGTDIFQLFADRFYPPGSLYWSEDPTNPAKLFGGTWVPIKDRFILAAGDQYPAGKNGGEATHLLSISEMPTHTHSVEHIATPISQNGGAVWGSLAGGSELGSTIYWSRVTLTETGDGEAHNNMPPYETYYCWKRVKENTSAVVGVAVAGRAIVGTGG